MGVPPLTSQIAQHGSPMWAQYYLNADPTMRSHISPTLYYLGYGFLSNKILHQIARTSLEKEQLELSPWRRTGCCLRSTGTRLSRQTHWRPAQLGKSVPSDIQYSSTLRAETHLTTVSGSARDKRGYGGTPRVVDNTVFIPRSFLVHFDCSKRKGRNDNETTPQRNSTSVTLPKHSEPVQSRHSHFHRLLQVHENKSWGFILV